MGSSEPQAFLAAPGALYAGAFPPCPPRGTLPAPSLARSLPLGSRPGLRIPTAARVCWPLGSRSATRDVGPIRCPAGTGECISASRPGLCLAAGVSFRALLGPKAGRSAGRLAPGRLARSPWRHAPAPPPGVGRPGPPCPFALAAARDAFPPPPCPSRRRHATPHRLAPGSLGAPCPPRAAGSPQPWAQRAAREPMVGADLTELWDPQPGTQSAAQAPDPAPPGPPAPCLARSPASPRGAPSRPLPCPGRS